MAEDIPDDVDLTVPEIKYEYLDHTADVQLHAWGVDLKEAFENVGISMFGYMTEIDKVEMTQQVHVEAEGDDLEGLLFHFLDEWLFVFSADDFFIPRKIVITELDSEHFRIRSTGYGEQFDLAKHPQGTEVKAITYSAMKIHQEPETGRCELFVIIDI